MAQLDDLAVHNRPARLALQLLLVVLALGLGEVLRDRQLLVQVLRPAGVRRRVLEVDLRLHVMRQVHKRGISMSPTQSSETLHGCVYTLFSRAFLIWFSSFFSRLMALYLSMGRICTVAQCTSGSLRR